MASSISVELVLHDWPRAPQIGVLGRDGDTITIVATGELHEPVSVAGMRRAVDRIIRAWLEPELFDSGLDAVWDAFHAVVKQKAPDPS